MNDASEELSRMTAGYDHQKRILTDVQRAKDELQKINSKLTAEKEVLNLATLKLESTISGLSDKMEDQVRACNQM